MLKDITLGQYFPGNTIIHRLDPRAKLLLIVIYIAALFTAYRYISYLIVLLFLAAALHLSTIRPKTILHGLKPVVLIIIITAILNVFYTRGTHILVQLGIFTITREGLERAVFMIVRIIMLIAGTFLLTYTTSPVALTDGLEALMQPLKRIHFPVHEISMMMSLALRFIPTLVEETDKIISAQKARGADFDSGNLIQRAKALLPVLIPLFVSSFRRADELAVAMESRCYHGGEGRTRMKQLLWKKHDTAAVLLGLALLAAAIVLRKFGL